MDTLKKVLFQFKLFDIVPDFAESRLDHIIITNSKINNGLNAYFSFRKSKNMLITTKQPILSNLFGLRGEKVRPHLVVGVETLFLEPQLDFQIDEGLFPFFGPKKMVSFNLRNEREKERDR